MELEVVGLAGAVAMVFLEVVKVIVRKVMGEPEYDFPLKFYALMLPILSFAAQPLLAVFGMGDYTLPTDWTGWLIQLGAVALSSLIALITYNVGLKPMKEYNRARNLI